jgi:hypothetical protein
MRNTLIKSHLTPGMIGIGDYDRLSHFQQVTDLTVGKDMLMNLKDCESIIQYFPRLIDFTVRGFQLSDNEIHDELSKDEENNSNKKINKYMSI